MKTSLLRVCAAAAASALLVALPATSFASTYKHVDPAKDVQQAGVKKAVYVPAQKTADIVHFKAGYTKTAVTETTQLRKLGTQWMFGFEIVTPHQSFKATVMHMGGTQGVVLADVATGANVTCDGLTFHADPTKAAISIHVPSSCVGSPSWVEVGAAMMALTHHGIFVDDALRKGGAKEANVVLSEHLKR